MNRIYQGRVRSVDFVTSPATKKKPEEVTPLPDWEQCLWDHHVIFQDAVNYYLLALAALADLRDANNLEDEFSRVAQQLYPQVQKSWSSFPRPVAAGARSLRDSITKWLGLDSQSSFDEAITKILEGNAASPVTRSQALAQLLKHCSGESGVQQGGREFLPLLCLEKTGANFKTDPRLIQRAWDMQALPFIIHQQIEDHNTQLLDRFGIYSLATPDNKRPILEPIKAKQRLAEAVKSLAEKNLIDQEVLARLSDTIKTLPEDFTLPNYAGASAKGEPKLRLYALMAFKYVERSPVTLDVLRQVFPAPKEQDSMPPAVDIDNLSDDPIKLARGERGYVFPAFTALPAWNPLSPGEPAWKEFDIAAFKEALKALNQFNAKTKERADKERDLRGELAILLGSSIQGWKAPKTESGDEAELPAPLDADLFKLARDLENVLTGMLDDVVLGDESSEVFGDARYTWREGQWRISIASLRGLGDLAEQWQKKYDKFDSNLAESDLIEIVKAYQSDEKNQRKIGSVPLFLALCEKRFWPLWLSNSENKDANEDEIISNNGIAFLKKVAGFHRTFDEFRRSLEPINLTPAEPVHSRRLYMFSDLTDKVAKVSFSEQDGESFVACAIAMRDERGQVSERRIRLCYSGRRLLRDELQGGDESRWLQPMTKALRIPPNEDEQSKKFDSAVALMPEFSKSCAAQKNTPVDRFLLNFPVSIDTGYIQSFLGKAVTWKGQFNGTRNLNLHLHWPETLSKTSKVKPWWNDRNLIANGFTTLSVDLGQRTAGAWALLRVSTADPRNSGDTKRPVREIGRDGTRTWFAEVIDTGLFRLPGEDQRVRGQEGKLAKEQYGKKGRHAREHEWKAALALAHALQADVPENWVGETFREKSLPEQNDSLIALANRRLSRLNTFHRWSCFAPDMEAVQALSSDRIKKFEAELSYWTDPEVMKWKERLEQNDIIGFSQAAGEGFEKLQSELEEHLVTLANRTVPLRGRSWLWQKKTNTDDGTYRELVDAGEALPGEKVWIRGQRGLTLARIEQLENLRKLFLRHNRSFDRKPGQKAKFGLEDRGRQSGEPCELLLQKIERMKEQRINQTAHLILAEALGVRLRAHIIPSNKRRERDIHGEYEAIPGRGPVDFIVIENLDRYLASQGRAPSENSRLMKWAHRSVRDKIKMLAEEPFGIPVVETAAAYSSQFCAKEGHAGARCEELGKLETYQKERLEKQSKASSKAGSTDPLIYKTLLDQFTELEQLNCQRPNKPPYTLYLPKKGGALFVALPGGTPRQADTNAAINIGLRALAAPAALDILHKIRTEKTAGNCRPVRKNIREKGAFTTSSLIAFKTSPSDKLTKASNPNFFYDGASLATFDRATLSVGESSLPMASGIGLWSAVNTKFPSRLVDINSQRLKKWRQKHSSCDEDDIPM